MIFVVILLGVVVISFIFVIFGMVGGIILMGIYVWFLLVVVVMILYGVIQVVVNGYCVFLFC